MGWKGEMAKMGAQIAKGVAKAFIDTDASLLEINPLVESKEGKLWALDAKLSIDDNALFRQPEIAAFYDHTQQTENEVGGQGIRFGLYRPRWAISAAWSMAQGLRWRRWISSNITVAIPANFLDVGGGASKEKVAAGFKIILSDPKVKAILVNIFGGIMNCATLAEGIIDAMTQIGIKVPLVVRMEGTNVEQGKKLLENSKLPIITADGLTEAAEKVCAQLKEG